MAIDTNETKNSLFGGLAKKEKNLILSENEKIEISTNDEISISNITLHSNSKIEDIPTEKLPLFSPKYQTFDKVTALLTTEQKNGLDRIAKRIMKHRSKTMKGMDRERITANTLIRALIDNFLETEGLITHKAIMSESDVYEWVKGMFK